MRIIGGVAILIAVLFGIVAAGVLAARTMSHVEPEKEPVELLRLSLTGEEAHNPDKHRIAFRPLSLDKKITVAVGFHISERRVVAEDFAVHTEYRVNVLANGALVVNKTRTPNFYEGEYHPGIKKAWTDRSQHTEDEMIVEVEDMKIELTFQPKSLDTHTITIDDQDWYKRFEVLVEQEQ